jgi:hypothetical protein
MQRCFFKRQIKRRRMMKRLMLYAVVIFVLAFPLTAFATETVDGSLDADFETAGQPIGGGGGGGVPIDPPGGSDPVTIDAVVDIKGYGEQTSNWSVGIFDIKSMTNTTFTGTKADWTIYGNQVGEVKPCEGGGCGMMQLVGSYDFQDYSGYTTTMLDGVSAMGSADMTTMGGLAACYTGDLVDGLLPSGQLYQTQSFDNLIVVDASVGGSGTPLSSVTGTIGYNATQTLNLNIGQ